MTVVDNYVVLSAQCANIQYVKQLPPTTTICENASLLTCFISARIKHVTQCNQLVVAIQEN